MTQTEATTNQSSTDFKAKRPWPLVIVSIAFLAAPFVNLASALYVGKLQTWYLPVHWFELFLKLSLTEQVLMVSDFVVAILLYFQTKRSWLCAILIVVLTTGYNFLPGPDAQHPDFQILSFVNILATLGVLGILYFFRYPYLDQRESLLGGPAKRTKVRVPAQMEGFGDIEIINISKTGCKVVGENLKTLTKGQRVFLLLQDSVGVPSEVIHTTEGFGLRFINVSNKARKAISQLKRKHKV